MIAPCTYMRMVPWMVPYIPSITLLYVCGRFTVEALYNISSHSQHAGVGFVELVSGELTARLARPGVESGVRRSYDRTFHIPGCFRPFRSTPVYSRHSMLFDCVTAASQVQAAGTRFLKHLDKMFDMMNSLLRLPDSPQYVDCVFVYSRIVPYMPGHDRTDQNVSVPYVSVSVSM